MRESVFKSVERQQMTDSISTRTYNMIIGGMTLYGLQLNAIMVATCHELAMGINPLVMIIGYFIVAAEPGVQVLKKQVEEETEGAIPQKALGLTLSIGVAISLNRCLSRKENDLSGYFAI